MTTTSHLTGSAPASYFEALAGSSLAPGWAKKEPQMWPAPKPRHIPTIWRYREARQALERACDFVSPEFAERRNLILVNPIPGNTYPTCRSLVAAYQLVLPRETARAHRHSPNALRLVLDAGSETYTVVDGVRIDVAEGDVVLTPSWAWHGHSNFGDRPAFWLDFLDVPLVQNLENMFFDGDSSRASAIVSREPDSPFRCKGIDIDARLRDEGSVEILAGGLKTIALHALGMKHGQVQRQGKRLDNSIFAVTKGEFRWVVEGLGTVSLARGDVIVVPCWHEFSIEGVAAWSQLIRVTDEPVLRALGFDNVSRRT